MYIKPIRLAITNTPFFKLFVISRALVMIEKKILKIITLKKWFSRLHVKDNNEAIASVLVYTTLYY